MFEPITTQAEFDERLRERLQRQCITHRAQLEQMRAEHQREVTALRIQLTAAAARPATVDQN